MTPQQILNDAARRLRDEARFDFCECGVVLAQLHGRVREPGGLPGFEHHDPPPPYGRWTYKGRRPPRIFAWGDYPSRDWCRDVLALDPCAYCGGRMAAIDHIHPRA